MADSSDIDAALVAKLQADTGAGGLMTLMPGGAWIDEAPPGSVQHVIVSLVDETDGAMFGGRASEDGLYLVKAVEMSNGPTAPAVKNIKAAAARIDALLEQGTLTVAGYSLMTMRRESRLRLTEVDELDASIRWQHRGGRYQVMVST